MNKDKDENEIIKEIFTKIDQTDKFLTKADLYKIILELGYWKTFRLSRKMILEYMENHNIIFSFRQSS